MAPRLCTYRNHNRLGQIIWVISKISKIYNPSITAACLNGWGEGRRRLFVDLSYCTYHLAYLSYGLIIGWNLYVAICLRHNNYYDHAEIDNSNECTQYVAVCLPHNHVYALYLLTMPITLFACELHYHCDTASPRSNSTVYICHVSNIWHCHNENLLKREFQ